MTKKNEKRKGDMDMEKQKKKRQESGHWEHAARCYSQSRNRLQKAIPGLGKRCVARFLIQELSPEGYAWTGNALRGVVPCSGMDSKRLFLDWEHAAAPPAQPEPAQPASLAPLCPASPRPAAPRPFVDAD